MTLAMRESSNFFFFFLLHYYHFYEKFCLFFSPCYFTNAFKFNASPGEEHQAYAKFERRDEEGS